MNNPLVIKTRLLVLLTVLVLILTSCSDQKAIEIENTSEVSGEKQLVVTSIFPLTDIVQQIGGERVEAVSLLTGGMSPHAYEPSTGDIKQLAKADLLVLVGMGVDQFAERLFQAHSSNNLLTISEGVDLLPLPELLLEHHQADEEDGEEHDADEDHGDYVHGAFDAHLWLDPILVRDEVAPRITTALNELDSEGESYFEQNLRQFQKELTALDAEINQVTAGFYHKKFIVFHSAWHYFAKRYGLEDINVEEFPNQELSPRELMRIVELGKEIDAGAIFAEPQFNSATAQAIADEYGAEVIILDPLGGPDIEGRDSYLNLMRWNLSQLMKGLK